MLSPQLHRQCFCLGASGREREMETLSCCAAGRHWPGLCFVLVPTNYVKVDFFNQERCSCIAYSASVVRWTWRCLKLEKLLPFPIQLTNSSLSASWTGDFCFHNSNTKKDDNTSIQKKGIFVFWGALVGVFTKTIKSSGKWVIAFQKQLRGLYSFPDTIVLQLDVFLGSALPSFFTVPPCSPVTNVRVEVCLFTQRAYEKRCQQHKD